MISQRSVLTAAGLAAVAALSVVGCSTSTKETATSMTDKASSAVDSATSAMTSMLPWQVAAVEDARAELGDDWWPYGLDRNRAVLDTFLRYHHEQGLSARRLQPEELFAPETFEAFKI